MIPMALKTYRVPRDNGEDAVLLLSEDDAKRLGLKAADPEDTQTVPQNKAAKPANKRGRPRKEE